MLENDATNEFKIYLNKNKSMYRNILRLSPQQSSYVISRLIIYSLSLENLLLSVTALNIRLKPRVPYDKDLLNSLADLSVKRASEYSARISRRLKV